MGQFDKESLRAYERRQRRSGSITARQQRKRRKARRRGEVGLVRDSRGRVVQHD